MTQVLVVANQTVDSAGLRDAIKDRMAEGPCQFTLLVPATSRSRLTATETMGHLGTALLPRAAANEQGDYEYAQRRMEFGLERLRQLGAEIDGDVGEADALQAIQDALDRRSYDEIILSTLPSGISRWLSQDLPHKVRRKFKLPLTVITPVTTG